MIFADLARSRGLERAEAQAGKEFVEARARLHPESNAAWMEQSGTVVIFDGPGSPVTQTFDPGLFEDLTPTALDTIERFFLEHCAPVIPEVSLFAGLPNLDLLCARGYRPVELSTVMYQPISRPEVKHSAIINVRVANPEDALLWADLSAKGWASDYTEAKASIRQFGTLAFTRESIINFLAEMYGRSGATGSLCFYEDVALFGGASAITRTPPSRTSVRTSISPHGFCLQAWMKARHDDHRGRQPVAA